MTDDTASPLGKMTTVEYLAQHPLFWGITKEHLPPNMQPFTEATHAAVRKLIRRPTNKIAELLALSKIAKEYTFTKGSVLAYQGEYADSIYILRAGQLETQYERQVAVSEENTEPIYVRHAIHLPGAVLEDTWIFTKQLLPYYMKARTDGSMILIDREKFLGYIKSHPRALRRIFPRFSAQAQEIVKKSRFQEYLRVSRWWRVILSFLPQRRSRRSPDEEISQEFDPRLARLHKKFDLAPEESIQFQSQRSPWVLIPYLLIPLLIAIGILVLRYFLVSSLDPTAAGGLWFRVIFWLAMSVPIGLAILQYIDWANDWFIVTDKQIIQHEFELFRFRKNVESISIDNVQSTEVETPNFFARILNLGTARITTAAQFEVILFDFITQPADVEKAIKAVKDQDRSVAVAKTKRTMRHAAEDHLRLPPPYIEVKYNDSQDPHVVLDNWKRLTDVFSTFSHRSENGDVVTYHKHRITLLWATAKPLGIFLVLFVIWYIVYFILEEPPISSSPSIIAGILIVANLLVLTWQVLDWLNDTYQITKQYVIDIDRAPFGFRESSKQAELSRVENVRSEQDGFIPYIFNYGKVHVETAGATSSIVFENVANPRAIQSELFKKRDDFRKSQEQAAETRRRAEFAYFVEGYRQTVEMGEVPEYKPLLKENEEGAPPE